MLIVVSAVLLVLGLLAYRRNLRPGGSGWLLAVRMFILLLFAAVFVGAVMLGFLAVLFFMSNSAWPSAYS